MQPTNEAEAQRRADALHLRGRTQLAGAASEAAEVQPARQGEMAAAAASCTALQPTQEAAAAGSKRAVNLQRLRMRRQQKWQSSDRCGSTQACGVGQQSHERQRHDHASEDERENVLPPAPVAQPLRKVHLAAEQMPGTAAASAAGLAGPAAASAAGMAGPAAASASDQEDEAEEAASSATLFAFQPRAVVAAAAAQEGAADGQGHPSAASDAAAAPDWAAAYQAFSTVDAAKQLEFVQEQHGKVRTTLAAGLVAGLAYQGVSRVGGLQAGGIRGAVGSCVPSLAACNKLRRRRAMLHCSTTAALINWPASLPPTHNSGPRLHYHRVASACGRQQLAAAADDGKEDGRPAGHAVKGLQLADAAGRQGRAPNQPAPAAAGSRGGGGGGAEACTGGKFRGCQFAHLPSSIAEVTIAPPPPLKSLLNSLSHGSQLSPSIPMCILSFFPTCQAST